MVRRKRAGTDAATSLCLNFAQRASGTSKIVLAPCGLILENWNLEKNAACDAKNDL